MIPKWITWSVLALVLVNIIVNVNTGRTLNAHIVVGFLFI